MGKLLIFSVLAATLVAKVCRRWGLKDNCLWGPKDNRLCSPGSVGVGFVEGEEEGVGHALGGDV